MKNWARDPLGPRSAAPNPKLTRRATANASADPLVRLAEDLRNKARLGDVDLVAGFAHGDDVVRIYRANHTYARVTLTTASLTHGIEFEADFTADGDHWDKLHNLLAEIIAESAPDPSFPEPVSERIVTELPSILGDEAHVLAVQATTTIRKNFRTYRHRFVLADDEYRVRFWPRTESGGVLALPFEFAPVGGVRVHGRLCIRRTAEILPLALSSTVNDGMIGTAWVAALCCYAQYVTSAGADSGEREDMPEQENSSPSQRSGGSARVGAHMRRLQPDHKASPEAQQNAARFHVTLPEGRTWVPEHDRLNPSNERVIVPHWKHATPLARITERQQRAA